MATAKESPKKVYLENLVRECEEIHDPRTRLLAMILASCADWKTYECRPSYKCLIHWTKFAKSTLHRHLDKLVDIGILESDRRYRRSSVYKFNVERLQKLAKPFKQPEPPDDEHKQPEHYSPQELKQMDCEHEWSPRGYCYNCNILKDDYDRQLAIMDEAKKKEMVERAERCPTLKRTGEHHWTSKGACAICEVFKVLWDEQTLVIEK